MGFFIPSYKNRHLRVDQQLAGQFGREAKGRLPPAAATVPSRRVASLSQCGYKGPLARKRLRHSRLESVPFTKIFAVCCTLFGLFDAIMRNTRAAHHSSKNHSIESPPSSAWKA